MQKNSTTSASPLVSIAVCTFNGERFLAKQLTSILNQTHQNIEVVVVDDCSTDDTINILEAIKNKDTRVKYFINEENLGFNKNFEKAIKLCSGDFIAISDQDDIWLPKKIERLLRSMKGKLMVYGNSALINEDDELIPGLIIHPERDPSQFLSYKNILIENFVTGHNILFKKDALKFIFPFPENGFYDWWMGFVMLYENQLVYCNEVVTHYRIHATSVINLILQEDKIATNTKRKYCELNLQVLEYFKNYKHLKDEDRMFIGDLCEAFREQLSSYYAPKLFVFLLKNFEQLFPAYKKTYIKRLAFIYRYSRGMKLFSLLSK